MTQVGTRNLKDQLSSYLRRAERGERIEVLRGGKPVAALVSITARGTDDESSRLATLAARGLIELPREPRTATERRPRVPARGVLASRMVIEDRR